MVDNVKVGDVDGPPEAEVRTAKRMNIIVVSAEEGRAHKRLQIHNPSDMHNTKISTL